ncbi:hypothetical protein DSECCO2_646660 [anaerobic digester metagenome]
MLCPLADCFQDEIWRPEVHIGHPHRNDLFIAEEEFAQIVFNACRIAAVNNFIKVVLHL